MARTLASIRLPKKWGILDQSILWALAIFALLTFVKTVLDGANKTTEAEAEHAKHYGKPAPVPAADGRWSQKEKVDFASFTLGTFVSLGGLIFAAFKAGGEAAAYVMWGAALIMAIFAVAWAATHYAKPKGEPTTPGQATGTVSDEAVTKNSDKPEGSSLPTS
ncbi:hypothetical protein IV500_17200 [Paeniglutamicibacter antarcticus]|uniref:Uncharacterized protein n=1 Tax=Arthrobacter terrae TaxID=2935737 RepID=A0A931CRJ4_9MICC|nr:hypothetical protein [Arthrobacter terrae]MBG0741110.1 hypothetical protein [Arthrobacter terrae]